MCARGRRLRTLCHRPGDRSSPAPGLPHRGRPSPGRRAAALASAPMTPRWSPPPGSLYSRAELRRRGVHPRRLASDEFLEVIPGHLTPAAAPAVLALAARLLQQVSGPAAVISHSSAAELLGVPLPRRLEYASSQEVHCTVPPDRRRRSGRGAVMHSRPPGDVVRVLGVRVSGPLELLTELAVNLEHDELVAACDQLVGPGSAVHPRPTLVELRSVAAAATGTYRIRRVRDALADARERVESPKETATRLLLLREGFAEPRINLPIRAPGSGESFRLDLAYPAQRIAIEYDGHWHSTDRARHRRDRRKDDVLHELGWRVVRASDHDLRSPGALLARLAHLGAPRA